MLKTTKAKQATHRFPIRTHYLHVILDNMKERNDPCDALSREEIAIEVAAADAEFAYRKARFSK